MKFHLDENVDPSHGEGQRRHGIDVTISGEIGLNGAEDEDQLAFAHSHGRVLVTQDKDFLILSARGASHSSVAYWKQGTRSIGLIIRSLIELHEIVPANEMMGQIEYLYFLLCSRLAASGPGPIFFFNSATRASSSRDSCSISPR